MHSCDDTAIWFYFVLYLISYTAVCTKIKCTNIFNNEIFTRVSYTIGGAIKTARNNNIQNIFNAKYNQITVIDSTIGISGYALNSGTIISQILLLELS